MWRLPPLPLPTSFPGPTLPWRRPDLLIAALALLLLLGLGAGTAWAVRRDREALFDQVAAERARSLHTAALRVESALDDVAGDLRFAARLVSTTEDPQQRTEMLAILVGSVRPYRGFVQLDRDGAILDAVGDPRRPERDPQRLQAVAVQAGHDALASHTGSVEVSPPGEGPDDLGLRAFAVRTSLEGPGQPSALALVVDTRELFSPLSLLSSEEATSLLVVGPHGRLSQVSSPSLLALAEAGRLGPILDRIRAGSGTLRLAPLDAAALEFPEAELIVSWRPIAMPGGDSWAAATLSSTSVLRALEAGIFLRVAAAGLGAGLVLMGLAAWMIRSRRRADTLAGQLRAADALARLRARAVRTLAHIPSMVLLIDSRGRVSEANPAFEARFGAPTRGAELGRALPEIGDEAAAELVGLVEKARSEGRVEELAQAPMRLGAAHGHWRVRVVPLDFATEDLACLLVLDDLTELVALRERLIRAEKLATVGELAAGIAHEIGTPLGVIRGRAEYIRGKLGDGHPQAPGLGVIVEQIERVVRTIRALLDFSRADPAVLGRTRLDEAFQRVVELLALSAESAGVRLERSLADPQLAVRADPDLLQQVLVNLVKNAIDASARGGRVQLRASRAGAGAVRIEVVDQGHGIPAADLHRVFDPFFTTRRRGEGTGLGLSVVLQVLRAHGASVELDSEPGRGTRAIVDWPLAA